MAKYRITIDEEFIVEADDEDEAIAWAESGEYLSVIERWDWVKVEEVD